MTTEVKELFDTLMCNYDFPEEFAAGLAEFLIDEDYKRLKVGKWIPASTKPGVHAGMKCSLCKARITYSEHFNGQHLYCHKCGAKMRGDE
jgi:hypothetical protein